MWDVCQCSIDLFTFLDVVLDGVSCSGPPFSLVELLLGTKTSLQRGPLRGKNYLPLACSIKVLFIRGGGEANRTVNDITCFVCLFHTLWKWLWEPHWNTLNIAEFFFNDHNKHNHLFSPCFSVFYLNWNGVSMSSMHFYLANYVTS